MATAECSRICRHSSKPSTSGSIRSSRTMSGSSVSRSRSARSPSGDTMVSKPRTARFDRIRSTMFGIILDHQGARPDGFIKHRDDSDLRLARGPRRPGGRRTAGSGTAGSGTAGSGVAAGGSGRGRELARGASTGSRIRKQVPRAWRNQLELAAVRGHDAAGDRQPEAGPGGRGAPPASGLERPGGQLGRHPDPVVGHAEHDLAGRAAGRGDGDPGAGRVVAERVAQQVDEDLLQPVVVGPHDGQAGRRRPPP